MKHRERSGHDRRAGVLPGAASPDYGLLTSVATVPSRRAAAAVRVLLESRGIRSSIAFAQFTGNAGEPRWDILVFSDQASSAYAVLTEQLGT
ncbi:hypothetical protein SAMN05661080_04693 [Modestobacter sp. DSM 44400]|uniref:hypothetical protein n=1 Tax=Modestobacter sp. DSM 44400 TaxID=1550230 RepID=UPI00089A9611|nr:hypothetical protein [Modestobacter sp. DSM 44400]SDY81362.1 hypothetical protein SAMN05661080_04693 [Modestobacter sp. DSM 44400]